MDVRATTQALVPVVGGMTAVVTATGAVAALAHVAAPERDVTVGSPLALAQEGELEGCEAYFGFGKEATGLNLVAFEVSDQNGDDGVAHAVPDDTQVALVLHFEGGEVECTPFGVTEEEWEAEFDDDWPLPYPGADHFVYPSANLGLEIEGLGGLSHVGYRVLDIPGGEHTLVSPTEEVELVDFQLDPDDLFDDVELDPRVLALIEDEGPGEDAADAYDDAAALCRSEGSLDGGTDTDPDVIAALDYLSSFLGEDIGYEDVGCFDVALNNADVSEVLGLQAAAEHVQEIVLALPDPSDPSDPSDPGPEPEVPIDEPEPAPPVVDDTVEELPATR